MLEILAEDGYLAREGGEWKLLQTLPDGDPEPELSVLLSKYPLCSAELTLTGRCGRHFAQAIKGEVEPLELLFPNGSLSDIEALYKDSPYFRFYNELMAKAVSTLVSGLPTGRSLRILEVGAGTGSVTSSVLPKLPPERTEYVFTDVSASFGSKARETFAAYPFVTYRVLDLEKKPLQQGFSPHSFDVVIAANALHATADLRQTLAHIRTLLRPDGLLLLLEATGKLRFADLIVGLTEGWWRFTDAELRTSHALLSREKWNNLLTAEGFRHVAMAPPPDGEKARSSQCLIVARGPQASRLTGSAAEIGSRKWLLIGEGNGAAIQMETLLKSRGRDCTLVAANADITGLGKLLRRADESPFDEVVYFLSADDKSNAPEEWRRAIDGVRGGCETLLCLVQALVSDGKPRARTLRVVTRGACPIDSDATSLPLGQYPVAALASTIALEYPELNCTHIDLDPMGADNEVVVQLLEAFNDRKLSEERRIAFRRGRWFVARLIPSDAALSEAQKTTGDEAARPRQLTISSPGILENLRLSALQRREPDEGEVEIEVHASGLGFRDVLIALGQYPGISQTLGYECSGKIVRVGPGASPFHIGQRVLAAGAGGFASFLTIPVNQIVPVPENLTYEDAATIPSAFLTAQYALCRLGKISAGERVLIHAAAGGVGLAAIQIARRAKAEIIATAGTPEKRAYLKSLGVPHIMDSRSLDFAREIMEITDGRGVDLVLNSLAGEFIRQSLSVTAVKGRFLEIGKTGIWDQAQVAQFRDISYFPIDLASEFEKTPDLVGSLWKEILPGFIDGTLQPLPRKIFAISDAATGFRYMAQGRHTGKIVLSHPGGERPLEGLSENGREIVLKPDGTYLVTGGLSGLGLLTAEWLCERGAKNLVLLGRREPSSAALDVIRGMQERGSRVDIVRGDVSDKESLAELFANFGHSMPPLRGIIHAAGTVDDGVLAQQTWERFEKVMASKVDGAWSLHILSEDQPLDFFVMFSSAVSVLGSAGQANHVAACAFEDALAHYRRAHGLPGLSINWGPWAEAGAATRGTVTQRVQLKGFQPILPEQGLTVLQRLIGSDEARIGVMSVDWRQYGATLPRGQSSELLSELIRKPENAAPVVQRTNEPPQGFKQQLQDAPVAKRRKLLSEFVCSQAMKVLGLDAARSVDDNQPLSELGLDSLMAVELRSLLSSELGLARSLPATLVFDYPTTATLTNYLAEEVLMWEKAPASEPDSPEQDDLAAILSRVEGLSDEDVNRMYSQE
jgi:NADPH:quinone reductase-like Zn-dependent oxidoreductase/SAM-dependent methyltransferase/acyl carrier protein